MQHLENLDGTKIEANANKYSFVWKTSTERYENQLQEKIQQAFQMIEEQIVLDDKILSDFESGVRHVSSDDLAVVVKQLEEKMKETEQETEQEQDPVQKKEKKQQFRLIRKHYKTWSTDFLPRQKKYEEQKNILGERNSYSKTDPDATFMRMKEDPMKNGQLKPSYNVQMATENQFITFYTIHQRPGDTKCFIPHLEKLRETTLPFPKRLTADSGYGSESNYVYAYELEEKPDVLIPYNVFRKEQTHAFKKNIRHVQNWEYGGTDDYLICKNNRKVLFKRYSRRTDKEGQVRDFKIYECEDCTDCPLKALCTKAEGNRQIHWNTVYEEMKGKIKRSLWSDEGAAIYARRKVEVEIVFDHIKGNRSLRRFSLRGLDKVNIEFGLAAIAHNFLKQAQVNRLFQGQPNNKRKNPERNEISLWIFFI